MLYLEPDWLERELRSLFEDAPAHCQPSFAGTLASDPQLALATLTAFAPCTSRSCACCARPRWTSCWCA